MRVPHYLPLLVRLFEERNLPPGELHRITVLHDDWCRIHDGFPCNCEFVVRDEGPPPRARPAGRRRRRRKDQR